MTENEAIEIIRDKIETCEFYFAEHDRYPEWCEYEFLEALGIAISTLKEIQQYREIGTVEECLEAVENQKAKNPSVHKQQYSDAYNCSKCGWTFIHKNETDWFCGQHYKFCPNCGQAYKR